MSEVFAPSGQVSSVWNAVKNSSMPFRILGWVLIIGLCAKYGISYLKASQDWSALVDRLVIISGFFIILFGSIYREISRIRKEKYANIQVDVHQISHKIRDLSSFLSVYKSTSKVRDEYENRIDLLFTQEIEYILDRFSKIFSMLTGTQCRASIKQVCQEDDDLYVFALARDSVSASISRPKDVERQLEKIDRLADNDDFQIIFDDENKARWFFENNLPRLKSYRNTSFPISENENSERYFSFLDLINPTRGWPLPYASTIVWPIKQSPRFDSIMAPDLGCIAFLSIDSPHRNVFNYQFDTMLGASVADSLFHVLYEYNQISDDSNGATQ